MQPCRLRPCDKNSVAEQLIVRRSRGRRRFAMHALRVLLAVILLASHGAAAAKATVLASASISNPMKEDRVRTIILEVAAELRIPEERLQEFVVLFISRKDARVRHWPDTTRMVISRAEINIVGHEEDLARATAAAAVTVTVYYIWIIDDRSDATVAEAVITAINQQERMGLSADDVITVAKRVCIRVSATVPVTSLR